MRKRNAARPVLESMEDRLVLSVSGATAHAAEIQKALAAHAARVDARAAHQATAHAAKSETATKHHAAKTAQPAHHSTTKPKSSSASSAISNFFKSVFPGL
jgi:hypothetical protein